MLYGFIAGILANNYDSVEVYLDGVLEAGQPRSGWPPANAGRTERACERRKESRCHRVGTDMDVLPEASKIRIR